MKFTATFKILVGLCMLLFSYELQAELSTHGDNVSESLSIAAPVIVGNSSACPGETVMYGVAAYDPNFEYEWILEDGGTIDSQGNGMVTITWDNVSGGPYELSVNQTDGNGLVETGYLNVTLDGDVVLVCNDNLNISLPDQCEVLITADMMLEGTIFMEDNYTIEVRTANGELIDQLVTGDYIGQELEVKVIHNCSGNNCWGNVFIEDKIAPVISCEDITLSCDEYQTYIPEAQLTMDNCGDAVIEYTTEEIDVDCDLEFYKIIEYTWTAVDESGNEAIPCMNSVYIERQSILEIEIPVSYDGLPGNLDPLSCDGNFPLNDEGYPDPSFTGAPGGDFYCASIEFTYSDIFIPLCDLNCDYNYASYKIIRNWVIVDWCTGEVRNVNQIIKVLDQEAPEMEFMADITMSVNPFDCSAQIPLPTPVSTDNCTEDEFISYDYTTSVGTIINGVLHIDSPAKTMPGADVEIEITASDCCGNESTQTFLLTIEDSTPPVVVADAHEIISLLPSGHATMYATSIDDGSYDNCGPIGFFVKRMDNGSPCPPTDIFLPVGNDNSEYNQVVHFCCSDVQNGPIMVQFRVCDDADMDGVPGTHNDNCNIAMVEVEVQDKFVPVIQCPPNVSVECNDFYSIDTDDEDAMNQLFGTAFAQGTCGVEVITTTAGTEDLVCGEGIIIRTFTATNDAGTSTCSQIITIYPEEESFLTCDRIQFEGLNNNVYNWCVVNDNDNDNDDDLPAITINSCEGFGIAELDINTAGLCTTVGYQVDVDTFTYAGSVCKKYVVHYEVIDQCLFDENFVDPITGQIDPFNSENGYFEFYLEYNVMDDDAPVLTCGKEEIEGDTCEGYTGPINIGATDECTPDDLLLYEWKIDYNNDGSIDYPANNQWHVGSTVSAGIIGIDALPVGTHLIYWRVGDGCGNVATCSQLIEITPYLKAPTPYCYNGISIAVMEVSGSVEIWASDFDAGSYDDCDSPITITMIPESDAQNTNTPFLDSEANWVFDCDYISNGIYEVIEIRIYVVDENGAYDYCTTTLRLEDNEANACPDNIISTDFTGTVNFVSGNQMTDVVIKLESDQPEYPILNMTNTDGNYAFSPNMFFDYTVEAIKDGDNLNGISTLDIVLIQKHILAINEFTNPYKKIAADVNNDCKVTGTDIVQLRKLILGKYTNSEFPSNKSWKFLTDENVYYEDVQPCHPKEIIEINQLNHEMLNQNFTGVKIGDVNLSASSNFDEETVENRGNEELILMVEDQTLERGEYVTVDFSALNYQDISGYQFTVDFDTEYMEYVNMFGRYQDINAEHINEANAEEGKIVMSYVDLENNFLDTDEVLFSMVFEVKKAGELGEHIDINSDMIAAESYRGENLDIEGVSLQMRDKEQSEESRFILYQNKPNPFKNSTTIGFELAESGQAIMTIYDVTGRRVFEKTDIYSKGYNEFIVSNKDLDAKGVLFIHLESNGMKAVQKMMLLD